MWAADAPKNAGEIVKLLLSKGATSRLVRCTATGRARLHRSLARSIVQLADSTALLYAARSGCYDCVEAMIGGGRRYEFADAGRRNAADDRAR